MTRSADRRILCRVRARAGGRKDELRRAGDDYYESIGRQNVC